MFESLSDLTEHKINQCQLTGKQRSAHRASPPLCHSALLSLAASATAERTPPPRVGSAAPRYQFLWWTCTSRRHVTDAPGKRSLRASSIGHSRLPSLCWRFCPWLFQHILYAPIITFHMQLLGAAVTRPPFLCSRKVPGLVPVLPGCSSRAQRDRRRRMPSADCVIDLLMDDRGYKYRDKVADRTNDVNQRPPPFSLAGPPSDTVIPHV